MAGLRSVEGRSIAVANHRAVLAGAAEFLLHMGTHARRNLSHEVVALVRQPLCCGAPRGVLVLTIDKDD